MNSEKLKAFVQLSRPVNILIIVASIPVACWIAGGTIQDLFIIFLAALTGALVTAGANAINDSFDIEIDRINRPDRPLPSRCSNTTQCATDVVHSFCQLQYV